MNKLYYKFSSKLYNKYCINKLYYKFHNTSIINILYK